MKISYLVILLLLSSCKIVKSTHQIFQDPRDGQKYGYITIDDRHWMTENMRYNMEGSKWNPANPDTLFGRLYDGYQAQEVCPEGWELSSTYDWFILEAMILPPDDEDLLYERDKVRGNNVHVFKSKKYWEGFQGTDSLGLNILPSGNYESNHGFNRLYKGAFFWTSYIEFEGAARFRSIVSGKAGIYYSTFLMEHKYLSCRCVRYIPEYEEAQKKKKQRNK